MNRFLLIFLIFVLLGCAHQKKKRRSDFVSGCVMGNYQILSNLNFEVNLNSLAEFCIILYDNNPEIEKKLDYIQENIPEKKILFKKKYEDYLKNPDEKDNFMI